MDRERLERAIGRRTLGVAARAAAIFTGAAALLWAGGLLPGTKFAREKRPVTAQIGKEKPKVTEKATFGAGCFWGVEATFRRIPGVVRTDVGYEGGHMENPTYKDVCTDTTGHAEVVQVEYDPAQVKYEDLLKVFWENHDPTTLNRQGPDVGRQYRSAVFYHSPEQQATAEASKAEQDASGKFRRPIVTEIVPAQTFYAAEEYHQQYLEKRGLASCHM